MIANSLFHFTKELETVRSILQSKRFIAFYNIENVKDIYPEIGYLGFPMTCFCDIPLKFIETHTEKYGTYGIGLRKGWREEHKICPVQYGVSDSLLSKSYRELEGNLTTSLNILTTSKGTTSSYLIDSLSKALDNRIRLSLYLKPFYNGKKSNYEDREWRYVPQNPQASKVDDDSENSKTKLNKDYDKSYELPFSYEDVEHLVTLDKYAASGLLYGIKSLKITEDEKYKLVRKISSLEEIKLDF